MFGFDRQAWLYSLRTFIASVVTLYIALRFDLPRPYWAMATVYIVSQPTLGPTRAKGIYRVVGTVVAGVATLVMLPNLAETPLLLSAAMSIWLALCLFMALLNRGPAGYAFLLAGYTTAFIGLPAVVDPESIFDTVIARSEEIILGTVMAVLFSSLVFPNSVKPMLTGQVGRWMRDAADWCQQILGGGRTQGSQYRRLAADLTQFQTLIEFARRDDPRHPNRAKALERMRERMLLLLPVLSSISDRLSILHRRRSPLPAELPALLEDLQTWLDDGDSHSSTYQQLRARVSALKPEVDHDIDHLLLATLLQRLEDLLDLWQDCQTLQGTLNQDVAPPKQSHYRIRTERSGLPQHVDYGMAVFSALSAGASLMAYCLLWIGMGWPGGGMGAMMAAVTAAFFAAQDDPTPNMMVFGISALLASVIAGLYQFGILPGIHDFGMLVLVLMVTMLPLGVIMHNPRTSLIGMATMVNMVTLLTITSTYNSNIQNFINSAVSMELGIIFAVVVTRLFRSVGAELTARRLVRQAWTTLAEAAEGRGQQDRRRFVARMLDLLGLLAPRLAATPESSDIASVDMLHEIRVGLNILQLRRTALELPETSVEAINHILDEVAAHYRRQAAQRRPVAGSTNLRDALDASLSRIGQRVPAGAIRDDALVALLGLRYGLFPEETPDPAATAAALI